MTLQLKRAKGIMHFQLMTSIALSVIGCIDYLVLAYGTIFTRAMFLPKKSLCFFSARKAVDERWEVVGTEYVSAGSRFGTNKSSGLLN